MAEKSNLSLNIKENILSHFPGSSAGKESTYSAGDPGSIPGSGDPLEKGSATHSSILGIPLWLSW